MTSLISYAIMMAVIVVALIPVVSFINSVIEEGRISQIYTENLQIMKLIDSKIRDVMFEAPGSRRTLDLNIREGVLNVIGGEDKIKLMIENVKIFSPGKTKEGNIDIISGTFMSAAENDIDNNGTTDLVLENNAVIFAVQKLGSASNHVFINTTNLISLIRNKRADVNVTPVSGIYIDDVPATSYGYGYTELTEKGDALPSSGIRLWLNSSAEKIYEAIFTLDAVSDFVTLEIRHIV
jgi:hypothetical protein